ncbi:MAG: hypothetical protein CMK32_02540 [Porticoccaceae bacterium]|nr:hypothetical protein [Porticoccaceae bacterium]
MTEWLAGIEQFHFLRPWWLLAFPLCCLLAWRLTHISAARGNWSKVIAPALLPLLVKAGKDGQRLSRSGLILAGLLASVALAGPTWEKVPLPAHKKDSALVILFDLSPSMLASDLKPDRLTRARLKTIDLLNTYREGSVALVAYSGDAHVVTPVTDDNATLIALLPSLHPDIMPVAGSRPEQALERGLELAMNAGFLEGELLFVTDGMTREAIENIHSTLRSFPNFRLSILGVGTEDGAPVPLGEQGFARDSQGGIVIASLNSRELEGLATRNGGGFTPLTATDADIRYLSDQLGQRINTDTVALDRTMDTWQDQGYWLALLLVPFAIAAFRKGLLALVLVTPLIYSPDSRAEWWQDLWSTPDQQAYRALENHQPEQAASLFEDDQWRGIAQYRSENYEAAAGAFDGAQNADGHYNQGNALARSGQLAEAIDAYEKALEANPDMDDARHNKAIVEQMLRDQNRQDNAQSGGDKAPSGDQENSQSPEDGKPSDSGDQGEGQDQSGADGEQNQPDPGETDAQDRSGDPGDNSGDSRESSGQQPEQPAGAAGQTDSDLQNQSEDDGTPNRNQGRENSGKADEQDDLQPGAAGNGKTPAQDTDDVQPVAGDEMSDAENEALQQWLRRVPDDPGGLLRRKFDYESRQRFRNQPQRAPGPPDTFSEERW